MLKKNLEQIKFAINKTYKPQITSQHMFDINF